ncbi:MAG: ferredoxin [Sedimentisphaerales bacterium]
MKVKVNPELCNGTGICEQMCPEVFEIKRGMSMVKVQEVPSYAEQSRKEAAEDCPTEAISIED